MFRVALVLVGFAAMVACGGPETVSSDDTDVSSDECQDDLERCSDDRLTIERCIDGQWEDWTDCSDGCELTEGVAECLQTASGD
jgi:hypothetical protein